MNTIAAFSNTTSRRMFLSLLRGNARRNSVLVVPRNTVALGGRCTKGTIATTQPLRTYSQSVVTNNYNNIIRQPFFVQQFVASQPLQQHYDYLYQTKRLFSSDELVKVLERELEEEFENNEMPENLSDLKTELEVDWRIVDGLMAGDANTSAITRMYKKTSLQNGAKVMIEFHCQDTEDVEEESDEETEEDEEEEPVPAVRFAVVVSKAGKSMIVTCLSEEGEISSVESIKMKSSDGDSSADVSYLTEDKLSYQGPVVDELAEDVQETFMEFFGEDCGITANVAAFVNMYADYKEQTQYTTWLQNVKDMVK